MQQDQPNPDAGLDVARDFIRRAEWTFAESMPWHAHEYATRHRCRELGIEAAFVEFAVLITDAGYWRPWGQHHWRSLEIDEWTFWLHFTHFEARDRTIINRWRTAAMTPAPPQLGLFDEVES